MRQHNNHFRGSRKNSDIGFFRELLIQHRIIAADTTFFTDSRGSRPAHKGKNKRIKAAFTNYHKPGLPEALEEECKTFFGSRFIKLSYQYPEISSKTYTRNIPGICILLKRKKFKTLQKHQQIFAMTQI